MSLNTLKTNQQKELFNEFIVNFATDSYLDELGACLEQKKKDLSQDMDYKFSSHTLLEFEKFYIKKKKKNLNKSTQSNSFKKVACFIGITLVGFAISINSVEAFRINVLNFFIDQKESFMQIKLKHNKDSSLIQLPKEWESCYTPQYIPSDFKLLEANKYTYFGEIIYSNASGDEIYFTTDSGESTIVLDTENAETIEIIIKNTPAKLISKNDYHTILFSYQGIFFTVSGPISAKELVEIAESIDR